MKETIMNFNKIFIIISIPIIVILLASCSANSTPVPTILDGLFAKSSSINIICYEAVTQLSTTNAVITVKVWLKIPKIKVEIEQRGFYTVYFADMEKKTGYIYHPETNLAVRTDMKNIPSSLKADTEAIRKYNPSIVGTETYDGKDCTIVSYNDGKKNMKTWLWNDYGIAVKSEVNVPEGQAITYIRNIDFSDITDSVFELPEGVFKSD
jgi:hypothetical protein